jgi:hypothetical protein
MKATIEFNLPDDQVEYYRAFNADTYHSALVEIMQVLRHERKYGDGKLTLEEIEFQLISILESYNIDLDR